MVFERKHRINPLDIPVGGVSGVVNNYNNTNASGYINGIRMKNMKNSNGGYCDIENDPPPEE